MELSLPLVLLVPRALVGIIYPAYKSLQAILTNSSEKSLAWLRYWVVLGTVSLLELLLDPLVTPASLPALLSYLAIKCTFLIWCMAPVEQNGSDLIFNQIIFPVFKEHHDQIEEHAEIAKNSIKDRFDNMFKKDQFKKLRPKSIHIEDENDEKKKAQ